MTRWGCQDCPALYGAWLSRCPRCGSAKELVVALWACTNCTTKYAVGLPRCPHCGNTDHVEDGQPMPKNTVHGGPSSAVAEPTQPGYMPPAEAEPEPATGGVITAESVALVGEDGPVETLPFGATVVSTKSEGGEESSPGTSSSASTEAPPTKSEPNETPNPSRARTTARRSKKAPTDSSSASSTAGQKTTPTSAPDPSAE